MPFYRFDLEAARPPEVILQKIRSVTHKLPSLFDRPGGLWQGRGSNLFWGSVNENRFSLRRNITYRNSFLPLIRGRIAPSGAGSNLRVIMFMHPGVAIFMIFWLCVVGGFAIGSPVGGSLILWGMLAFGLLVPVAAFFAEAVKARRVISSLALEGTYQPIQ